MKKLIVALITALIAMNTMATQIMWVGIGNNPQIEINGVMAPLATWIASLSCDPADVGGRIRVGDMIMPAGWENPPGSKEYEFDNDITEFELALVDTEGNMLGYTDWQPIRLDNTDLNAMVFFELGYWDENANWDFVPVASANALLSDLWNAHTYEAGTLLPPTETPWRPFAAVPEPSVALFALLGFGILLKRRK